MSTIRPDLPALPSVRPEPGAAQDVRAAFFRAALDQARGVVPAVAQAPGRMIQTAERAPETSDTPTRTLRPGSLLDIRV